MLLCPPNQLTSKPMYSLDSSTDANTVILHTDSSSSNSLLYSSPEVSICETASSPGSILSDIMFDQQRQNQPPPSQKPLPEPTLLNPPSVVLFPASSSSCSSTKTRKRSSVSTSSGDEANQDEEPSNDYGYNHKITSAAMKALGSDGIKLAEQFANGVVPLTPYNDNATPIKLPTFNQNPSAPSATKRKKNPTDMDEDERLLASEDAKKLTSRQRRQLRNRVSARHFRLRRKEYINHLEGLVINMTSKINKMNTVSKESQRDSQLLALIGAQYPVILRQAQVQIQITPQMVQMPVQPQAQPQLQKQQAFSGPDFSFERMPISSSTPPEQYIKHKPNMSLSPLSALPNNMVYPMTQKSFTPNMMSGADETAHSLPASSFQTIDAGNNILAWNASQHHDAHTSQACEDLMESIRMKPSIVNLLPSLPPKSISPSSSSMSSASLVSSNQSGIEKDKGEKIQLDSSLINYNFQWNDEVGNDPTSLDGSNPGGYLQLPNQRIYPSAVPDLEKQLEHTTVTPKPIIIAEPSTESTTASDEHKVAQNCIKYSVQEKDVEADTPKSPTHNSSSSNNNNFTAREKGKVAQSDPSPNAVGQEMVYTKLSTVTAEAIFRKLDLQMASIQI